MSIEIQAADKDVLNVKSLVPKSKNHESPSVQRYVDKLTGTGATTCTKIKAPPFIKGCKGGRILRALLEDESGLWAAVEGAMQTLQVYPLSPDKVKASLQTVAALTSSRPKDKDKKTESMLEKHWALYVNLR